MTSMSTVSGSQNNNAASESSNQSTTVPVGPIELDGIRIIQYITDERRSNAIFHHYMTHRVLPFLMSKSRNSSADARWYNFIEWPLIVLSYATPVFIGLGKLFSNWSTGLQVVVFITSFLVAVLTSLLKTFNWQAKWLSYRRSAQDVIHEFWLYVYQLDPYSEDAKDVDTMFRESVEDMIKKSNDEWLLLHSNASSSS